MGKLKHIIEQYEEVIYDMYWKEKKNFGEISKLLGIASAPTLYRYMKKYSVVRTREEQLKELQKSNTGREWTEETRAYVSKGVKRSYDNVDLRKQRSRDNKRVWSEMTYEEKMKRAGKGLRAAQKKAMQIKSSSIEDKVAKQLDILGIRYVRQKQLNDCKFYVDFYIPSIKLVIECNGDYWHKLPDRVERDKMLKEYVERTKHKIIFIWEHEIKDDWFWIGDYLEEVK